VSSPTTFETIGRFTHRDLYIVEYTYSFLLFAGRQRRSGFLRESSFSSLIM